MSNSKVPLPNDRRSFLGRVGALMAAVVALPKLGRASDCNCGSEYYECCLLAEPKPNCKQICEKFNGCLWAWGECLECMQEWHCDATCEDAGYVICSQYG